MIQMFVQVLFYINLYVDHGTCTNSDTCVCHEGYGGNNCQYPICWNILSNDPTVCSGHGTCTSPDICVCSGESTGAMCETYGLYCSGKLFNDTTVCSGHGTCVKDDYCLCNKWWYGRDCEFYIDNKTRSISSDWITIQPQGNLVLPYLSYAGSAFDTHGNLYIYGGYGIGVNNILYVIDAIKLNITTPTTYGDIPPGLVYHAMYGDYHDYIYIHGGSNSPNQYSDLYKLDTRTLTWKKFSTSDPRLILNDHKMVSDFDGNIYVFGGYNYYYNQNMNNMFKWDNVQQQWTLLSTVGTFERVSFAMTIDILNNNIYIIGGDSSTYLNDVIEYNINTNISTTLPVTLPYGIEYVLSATYYDQNIYIFGGDDGTHFPSENAFWKLDIRNNILTNIAVNFTKKDRMNHIFGFDMKYNRLYMGSGYGYYQSNADLNDLYYLNLDYQCYGISHNDTNVCLGKGNCTDQDTCTCVLGYGGNQCQYYTCFDIVANDINVCSGFFYINF